MASHEEKGKKPFYKKWWFWVIIIFFVFWSIGMSQRETSQVSYDMQITNENDGDGNIGKYHITIKDYNITYDNSNKAVLLVKFAFTNNDKEEKSFTYNLSAKAYQNGVELTTPISSYGIDELDWNDKTRKIKPGVTYEFNMGYYIEDEETDVEIEVEPYWGSSDDSKVTKILQLKNN